MLAALTFCACTADARPQLVLHVDTDAWLTSQLATFDALSRDATIDLLRIDVLDGSDAVQEVIVADPSAWPVSFGVRSPGPSDATIRLRLRAFQRAFASTRVEQGRSTLEPPPEVTIERVVELPLPTDGVVHKLVRLSFDCMNVPSSDEATCIDDERLQAPISSGITDADDLVASTVGTWPHALAVDCQGAADDDRICVAGGFIVVGDDALQGVVDADTLSSTPYRPLLLSPFFMDRFEYTVARYKPHAAVVTRPATERDPQAEVLQHCTYRGTQDTTTDDHALNCVFIETAVELCARDDGVAPSEAQWEHAARARQRRRYPWGDDSPTCTRASYGRAIGPMDTLCPGIGSEPVGARSGDISRDGIHDLGGGVTELTLDPFRAYDDPCWSYQGIAVDGHCVDETAQAKVGRGSSWNASPGRTHAPRRTLWLLESIGHGFRCVYPETAP